MPWVGHLYTSVLSHLPSGSIVTYICGDPDVGGYAKGQFLSPRYYESDMVDRERERDSQQGMNERERQIEGEREREREGEREDRTFRFAAYGDVGFSQHALSVRDDILERGGEIDWIHQVGDIGYANGKSFSLSLSVSLSPCLSVSPSLSLSLSPSLPLSLCLLLFLIDFSLALSSALPLSLSLSLSLSHRQPIQLGHVSSSNGASYGNISDTC